MQPFQLIQHRGSPIFIVMFIFSMHWKADLDDPRI